MCLTFLGLPVLAYGIYLRLGGNKVWYLTKGVPIIVPVAVQHMMIPLGVNLIAWDIMFARFQSAPQSAQALFNVIAVVLLLVMIIWGVWPPRWLRPHWLVYLEDEYGSVMYHLLAEARKNAGIWEERVRTQDGLEAWAEETRIRLGYPPHPGQIERAAKKSE